MTSIVITSIAAPNRVLRTIARGCSERGMRFYVAGDVKSPPDFHIDGCSFLSVEDQIASGFNTAALCPTGHYARKNIGYLLAIRDGAELIVETDDDNMPMDSFWHARQRMAHVPLVEKAGWLNVYRFFTDANIWPRGLPLDAVQGSSPALGDLPVGDADCPIQQGLADDNPDVDAIYRLILPLPLQFAPGRRLALGRGTWCPFNSQNTSWWRDAFPLLYLPAYCSFRMTDIWRSFVTQRIAWENGWSILFESPTVAQDRNDHSLMRDFADEIPGYLHNSTMAEVLAGLRLRAGRENLGDNLLTCYEALVRRGWIGAQELGLIGSWIVDLHACDC